MPGLDFLFGGGGCRKNYISAEAGQERTYTYKDTHIIRQYTNTHDYVWKEIRRTHIKQMSTYTHPFILN